MSSVRQGRSTGRPIGGGLPSGPRARSVGRADTTREREAYPERDRDYYRGGGRSAAPTRSVRPQRSVTDLAPRSQPPPPDVPPLPRMRRSDASSASAASSSSGASSLMDRMKGRGGYASSRTSFEDEPEPPRKERGGWLRERAAPEPEPEPEPEYGACGDRVPRLCACADCGGIPDDAGEDGRVPPGYGLSLWSRVAVAANTLTVSVSKAWASNIAASSGEQTPPGQESRLTRAMKAYHLDKARDPTDLPAWLFDEHERRPVARGRRSNDVGGGEYHDTRDEPPPTRSRGLRDIYDAAAASAPVRPEARESSRPRQEYDAPAGPSKANDRLRALRDAKRTAAQRNAPVSDAGDERRPSREERAMPERGLGRDSGAHQRAPSLPAGVRPGAGGGLPVRPSVRRV
ncbi:hypothetical protein BC834DRAFT_204367 [Gloeopeniophorella convolvens]|nr:hypothetical protein BC834DRAFT_204367 [Gloeopeniophorella convolvens]